MPDNAASPTPIPPVTPPARPKPKNADDYDRAHVPMSEEMDSAKWTLPPIGIVLIGVAIIGVIVAGLMFATKAKPAISGSLGEVNVVQLQDNTVLAAIKVDVTNSTDKQWWIREISATVKTDQGDSSDTAATATDAERYFQAFPDLGKGTAPILRFDQKFAPGQHVTGTVVVSFPVTKAQFDARKQLSVKIMPFDNRSVTFTK